LTGALAFIINVAILIWVARWLAAILRSRLIAILGTCFVGVVLSVVADFTIAYSVDGYDRSIQAIIERGTMSGLLAMIVGYLVVRRAPKNSN
jgi:fructose-specific phosphotransferase system IIC component